MYIREIKLILGKSFNRKPKLNISFNILDDVNLSQSLEFFAFLNRKLFKRLIGLLTEILRYRFLVKW